MSVEWPSAYPEPVKPPRWRRWKPARFGSIAGAVVCWWLSMSPTLLPRAWTIQAAVSAVSAAGGWLVGRGVGSLFHRAIAAGREPLSAATRRVAWLVLPVAGVVVVAVGCAQWVSWQNDQRDVIGMPHVNIVDAFMMTALSVVLLGVLVFIGRGLVLLVRRIDRLVTRFVPDRWARLASAVAVVVVFWVFISFAGRTFVNWTDSAFGAIDGTTEDGVSQPVDNEFVSGGKGSLVSWDSLGYQGRTFVARASTETSLRGFAGPDATVLDPIRVYVGLDSADSVEARAALAVAELERTGAFDRKVLMLVTVTGTGWINPDATRTLEHIYGGDTAIVGVQYSFLPSWIASLVGVQGAGETAEALSKAVHAHLDAMPADQRPKVVAFGESLGSLGAETALAAPRLDESLAALAANADAVLFVGPTADNPIFQQLIDARQGAPTWKPEPGGAPHIRFSNQPGDVPVSDASWTEPRTLYLHHPTDAVGTWAADHLWSHPGWVDQPLGPGVPHRVRWVPWVTWVQETADLMAGFSAKPGFGHDYRNQFVESWAAIIPPDGWTEADTTLLSEYLGHT
jgi:uncharacterized membrane protein